jgi:hypothetical protein
MGTNEGGVGRGARRLARGASDWTRPRQRDGSVEPSRQARPGRVRVAVFGRSIWIGQQRRAVTPHWMFGVVVLAVARQCTMM